MTQQGVVVKRLKMRFVEDQNIWMRAMSVHDQCWNQIRRTVVLRQQFYEFREDFMRRLWGRNRTGETRYMALSRSVEEINL